MHIPSYVKSHKKGLPITSSILLSASSVRHELQSVTQISLGLVDDSKPSRSKSAVPPLARGRGMSYKVRTPSEDHRYKMVECLRLKEEKRGFTGSMLRKCKSARLGIEGHEETMHAGPRPVVIKQWGPGKLIDPRNIDDLIRPNSRSFTTLTNSGFTRSEKLVDWVRGYHEPRLQASHGRLAMKVVDEDHKVVPRRHRMEDLEDCYRRVFKGNVDSPYSLMPHRQLQHEKPRESVGLIVRSYRNPARADILAEFPQPSSSARPRAVSYGRSHLPSPYYQWQTSIPRRAGAYITLGHGPVPGQINDASGYQDVLGSIAAQRSGRISTLVNYKSSLVSGSLELHAGKEYMSRISPTARSSDDIQESATAVPSLERRTVEQPQSRGESHGEEAKEKEIIGGEESVVEEEERKEENEEQTEEEASDDGRKRQAVISQVLIVGDVSANSSTRPRPRLTTSNSGAEIMLGLETDDGKTAEVEIDSLETDELQPEEIPKGRVRKTSIVEKLSKSKESELIALSILENAGQRQREFEKLISEHQELVQEISRTPSAENIVQSETGRDP